MTTIPINIQPSLKKFLSEMKYILKQKSQTVFSEGKVLLYYLENSNRFQTDYAKHLQLEEMKKIFDDENKDIIPVLDTEIESEDLE